LKEKNNDIEVVDDNLTENLEEILKNKNPKEIKKLLVSMSRSEKFSGPLPHPDHFKEYEDILPGSADRILKMAEKQQSHNNDMEKRYFRTDNITGVLGIVSAFGISIIVIGSGVYLVMNGHSVTGTLFAGFGLTSLVGTFIYGTNNQNDNNTPVPLESTENNNTTSSSK